MVSNGASNETKCPFCSSFKMTSQKQIEFLTLLDNKVWTPTFHIRRLNHCPSDMDKRKFPDITKNETNENVVLKDIEAYQFLKVDEKCSKGLFVKRTNQWSI